jgi:thiol:disulfide interchange protein DsbC
MLVTATNAEEPAEEAGEPETNALRRLVPDREVGPADASPVPGIFRVKVGPSHVYLTTDGAYAFTGDLLDLRTGENLTERQRGRERLALLERFPEEDLVWYPAGGREKARLLVFTDVTCPYCRKLHEEVPALRREGVSVGYIPFPRGGADGKGAAELRAVWCASDRANALDIAKGVADGELSDATCKAGDAVAAGYRLGARLGVRGTPTIVFPDGTVVGGYANAKALLARLGLSPRNAVTRDSGEDRSK